ncbi:hypothetical protein BTA51_03515 [Hahella sp. CCB-MM4]|uniref:hypothetical protein n=1 Tax=Hahella sp. (strain CCB-MM4) TaxID=1926491 RepID=UPI000B9BF9AF|nr:hypothetical protein [Hahella sp. CCB-MM4]OZG75453.1 hypothetical protein BTA51_03515 [Hahella sp. CCB-MM4]
MNKQGFIVWSLAFLVLGTITSMSIKGETRIVKARYLHLACEKCYHLEVEASSDQSLVQQVIVPTSDTVNIENLIAESIKSGESLCLTGAPYVFNLGIFDPKGIRFFVKDQSSGAECRTL